MPVLTVVGGHATGDVYPAADYNTYTRDNINYLIQAGATLLGASTLVTTNEFHIVSTTAVVDNINPGTQVVGQTVELLFQAASTMRNNGGGTGNIRTVTGADRKVYINEIVTLMYDGANWREMVPESGRRIAYASKTSSVTTTGTTFAAGADLLASALSFTADGNSDYLLEVFATQMSNSSGTSNDDLRLNLDGADGGIIQKSGATTPTACAGRALIVAPAAGAHTVNVRMVVANSTGTVLAGAGGPNTALPITVTLEVA